jgi:RNA polymerase sigma factor (sigma-70 family)
MYSKDLHVAEDKELKLIRGCIAWKREAQNALYERYASKMFAVCFRYSRSREDAEDTFHEGFMKVFQNIKSFRRQGSLEGWIRRIMVHTAIEKFRKQSQLYAMVRIEDHTELPHDTDHDLLDRISAKELMELVRQLPPVYKMVFNLYAFEGYKHREIAEQLGITEGTSKSNLSDARTILKRKIKAEAAASEITMYHEG